MQKKKKSKQISMRYNYKQTAVSKKQMKISAYFSLSEIKKLAKTTITKCTKTIYIFLFINFTERKKKKKVISVTTHHTHLHSWKINNAHLFRYILFLFFSLFPFRKDNIKCFCTVNNVIGKCKSKKPTRS